MLGRLRSRDQKQKQEGIGKYFRAMTTKSGQVVLKEIYQDDFEMLTKSFKGRSLMVPSVDMYFLE